QAECWLQPRFCQWRSAASDCPALAELASGAKERICSIVQFITDYRYSSQVFQNKLQHHLSHMTDEFWIAHAVSRFRINHELELFPCFLQLINELDRILQMHVVVNSSMDQE